jgi:CubicO group peptidase (beta-lactamase class C family)
MTAVLIGLLVEQGNLKWETTIAEVFPDIAASSSSPLGKATVLQLLSHRAGVPPNLTGGWRTISVDLPIGRQREMAVGIALSEKDGAKPGAKFEYSNWGYVIAGAMAERAPFGGQYALGWGTTRRDWGGGTVLTHTGSNTMNTAVVWMAPRRDFAVLVATNQAGDGADEAVDAAASALITAHGKATPR